MSGIEKITTFSSICLIILRELRVERGIHQAQVADWIGKTPSAWTKVESGKSPLHFELFIRVCFSFQVQPSAVMATAERYAALLRQYKWAVLATELNSNEDALLLLTQEYWGSPGFRAGNTPAGSWGYSVLNGPLYNSDGTITLVSSIRFALDEKFKEYQLNTQKQQSQPLPHLP
ncbi:TPA: helix-turn-helix transcriptional regulator [Citrobacter freundii]|nr:helix-turn-helix transcriptional regulator [Citrobacter freundii]